MEVILNGKMVADELTQKLPKMNGEELSIITIGEDPASKVYVRNKIRACEKIGLVGKNYKFNPQDYQDERKLIREIRDLIYKLNNDSNVVGIMIQRPYKESLMSCNFEGSISPKKDVDGLSPANMLDTLSGRTPEFYPATPQGIMFLLDYYGISVEGKNVVVIGRSDIVGKPMAAMMTARNATVILCHSKTRPMYLKFFTMHADIIISAVGKPKYLNSSYITGGEWINNPVIIDVAICRDENGKLCGDVDFDSVYPYSSKITKVPGGVGPMTIYSLLYNCCKKCLKKFG